MTENNPWPRTILAGAFVGAALLIEHQLLYDEQALQDEPELTLFASNVLGTGTIAAGVLMAAPDMEEAGRHLTIAAIGGIVVFALRIIRRELRIDRARRADGYLALGISRGARGYGQPNDRRDAAAGRS